MQKTIEILVRGKVQGVYYRQSAKEKAYALSIVGTVQNLSDGRVKLVVTGEEERLQELLDWCRVGPSRAVVEEVSRRELPYCAFDSFTIDRRG